MIIIQFNNIMLAKNFCFMITTHFTWTRGLAWQQGKAEINEYGSTCGYPIRFHNIFRMSQVIFTELLCKFGSYCRLYDSHRINSREVLRIILFILGHNESVRAITERFHHSTKTISRYFSIGPSFLDKEFKTKSWVSLIPSGF